MKLMLAFLALLLLTASQDTDQPSTHDKLQLDTPHQKELLQPPFTGRYIFNIDKAAVDQLASERWFFFVEVEPNEEKEWVSSMIELSVGPAGSETSKHVKSCDSIKGGLDSCFLTNKQFDYAKEAVHVKIRCFGPCKFKLSGEISNPYKLEPGKTVKMDFENTAYSQVFSLDTTKEADFDQLRVILRPEGFLQFPAPIGLYLNKGDSVPTKDVHDYKGMTLWDNGQGIFLDAPLAAGTFTILIEGPEKNVLLLETMLVSLSETNVLPENLPFFDFLGEESSKKYQAKVNPAKGVCLQMSTFSGAIKLLKIYDQEMQEIDEEFPPLFRPYGELEYQLDPAFFAKNKKKFKLDEFIIFELQGVKESTFVLEAYELNQGINRLLPERTRYLEIPAGKTHQYYIEQVELADKDFKKAEFEVVLTTEEAVELRKRVLHCKKENGAECQLKVSELTSATIKNPSLEEISSYKTVHEMNGVQILKFDIPASKFSQTGNSTDVKKYLVLLTLENKESSTQLYTIQYINSGKSVHLREGEVRTDRISLDQSKYYSFTNTNEDVKEIRAHLMEISGRVVMEGFWKDPRQVDQTDQSVMDYHNSVRFQGVKKNQTVYLKVTGQESAYFSVQLQLMKEGERQWWHQNKSSSSKGYNQVIIVEDIAYEFVIAPKSKEVYQIHSKQRKFLLDMSAHLPVELCMTEKLTEAPFLPNCEEKETLTKSKVYDVTLQRGNIANIGVRNSNDKEVKFNIRFTSTSPPADNATAKCLPSPLGKISKHNLQRNSSACYAYALENTDDDLEVMVDVVSDEYDSVNVIAEINGVERVEVIGATHIFRKAELQKACEKSKPCPVRLLIESKTESEVRFSAQFMGGTFFLLDGIANQFSGTQQARSFVYELYNKVNTTVILENRNGFYKFYGKVVEAALYWSGAEKFPTAADKLIESSNPFYYLYQISVLGEAQIKAAKCEECLLLISVVKEKESFDQGQKSRFLIEVTQEDRYLKDGQPVFSFLARRSVAFYEYYNSQNGSILVSVGSQNQDCVQVYIKQGSQVRASGSDFDKKTETSNPNTLVLENAVIGDYSIMAEASENCYFSIDVTTATNEALSTIERGHYKDIALDKDETAKFIFQNNNETIKMLTLHVSGELTLSARAFKDVKELIATNLTKTKYQWSGRDFLRIDKEDKDFCATCVYLVVVRAEKQSKTTVMIPDGESEFPIMMDSSIKDELKKGEVEQLRIFTQRIQQFEVKVQYGSVQIEVVASHGDKVEFSQTYEANQATQYGNISTPENASNPSPYPIHDYSFMRYSKVRITAIKDAGFSFGFISDKEESKRGNRVKYGVPEYVNLVSKKRECLQGTLNDKDEEFLISITGDKQEAEMNGLEISCRVGKELLELQKDIAKSEMIVSLGKPPATLPAAYEFCMLSSDDVFLTFIHSSNLNYFPENKALMVAKEMNLTFYAEGKSLIEVNECRSRAIVSISHSFNTLGGINSEIRQVRKTNNIIEFNYYGPVYLHVEAASATVAWRKKDDLTRLGRGYDEYTSNKIRLDRNGNELKVEVFPLKQLADKPTVTLTNVDYTAYLAEEEMNLYDAINCNHGTYLQKTSASKNQDGSLSLSFDVGQVLKTFADKKYILVGVLANAVSNIDKDSNYRFIYPYQQILISALKTESGLQEEQDVIGPKPTKETTVIIKEDSGFTSFVLYFTLIVVLGFVARWAYRKWIKKFLKRRRQQLSEQGTGEVRYQEFSSYT